MSITNKIKRYKGWKVARIETAEHYNNRHYKTIDIFFNSKGQAYKNGYVVSLTHAQGGEAKTLIKNKFDLTEFINFI
mgnify:CR=1 FL=1